MGRASGPRRLGFPAVPRSIEGNRSVSHRFRVVLPSALIALAALAACTEPAARPAAGPGGAKPAPSSAAPAGPSKEDVCKTVSLALIDGSTKIADDAVKSIDENWTKKKVNDSLRARFGAMAREVSAEAPGITDPGLKTAVDRTAAKLVQGSRSANPSGFLAKDFQAVTKDLDKACPR